MFIVNRRHDYRSTYPQLRGLVDLLLDVPIGNMAVEIGSGTGDSSELIASRFKTLWCIDPIGRTPDFIGAGLNEADTYGAFLAKTSNRQNIIHFRQTSDSALPSFADNSLDFVYVDGFHSYEQCKKDIINYWPKLSANGIMAGHDYSNEETKGVTQAVNELFGQPARYYIDWSWLVYKNGRNLNLESK